MSKSKAPTVKTWKAVEKTVGEIGALGREAEQLINEFNDKVAELQAEYVAPADELNNQKVALERAVEEFVLAHQGEMEKPTLQLTTGSVQVAKKPPSIVCVEGDEATLKILKLKELANFIRVKESVNKTAIRDAKLDKRQLKAIKVEMRSSEKVNIKPLSAALPKARPTAA